MTLEYLYGAASLRGWRGRDGVISEGGEQPAVVLFGGTEVEETSTTRGLDSVDSSLLIPNGPLVALAEFSKSG